MNYKYFLLLIGFFTFHSYAQNTSVTVKGGLSDANNGTPLFGATILLRSIKDSTLTKGAVSDEQGKFLFQQVERAFYRMEIKSLGYKPFQKLIRVTDIALNLGNINLEQDTEVLKDVEVKGELIPVEQRGDTVLYNADAFKVNPDASTMDLVRKMPGIVVDGSGVTANGESIEQVLLDGKRFFGQDPLLSLNSLPAEVVDKIEVFDQQSEQSQFTGFDDGNTTKTMNVVTKEEKRNGQFGNLYGGVGNEARYSAGGTINSFKKEQRLTILGMTNNINQQNFSNEDLAQVSGGQRRGRRRGGNNNLMTGVQDGITDTQSLGINFTDDWGKKATFEGSYFLNKTVNNINQKTSRETYLEDTTLIYIEQQDIETDNLNHRFNARITYNINDANKLVLRPSLSFQNNSSIENTLGETTTEEGQKINSTDNRYQTDNTAYYFKNELMYQHKFEKIGRSITFELATLLSTIDRENYYKDNVRDSLIQYLTVEKNNAVGIKAIYSEPVGNSAQLSISYGLNHNGRASKKKSYNWDYSIDERQFIPALSNEFESDYNLHESSVTLSNRSMGSFYNLGVTYQHARLSNNQLLPEQSNYQNAFNSILPMLMIRTELKDGGRVFIRYRATTQAPSVSQLQNVIDNSIPLFWSFGNPDLNQSYTHSLLLRWNKTYTDKNSSLANFTRIENTQDYMTNAITIVRKDTIVSNGLIVSRGAQISQPTNLDGYWRINNNTNYGWLVSTLKSKMNASVGMSYMRQPGVNNDVKNTANTYSGNMRISLASNFSENIDFNIYYNVSANRVINTIQKTANSKYMTQTLGGKFNFIFAKGIVFRSEIFYEDYRGMNENFDTKYVLWNMAIAKKFLKNQLGELELSVFDLLDQNRSISQNINSSFTEETRTVALKQYFLLTFTYQLRRFKSSE